MSKDLADLGFGLCAGAILLVICFLQMPNYFTLIEAAQREEGGFEYRYSVIGRVAELPQMSQLAKKQQLTAAQYVNTMMITWPARKRKSALNITTAESR